jgi:uncharacterized protein (DUF1778 family)
MGHMTSTVKVRLTTEDRAEIERAAAAKRLSLSGWLRSSVVALAVAENKASQEPNAKQSDS